VILIAFICVVVSLFYCIGEAIYERDWPRKTLPYLVGILFIIFCASGFGQAIRIDQPILTQGPNVPVSGGPLPQALWVSNGTVQICQHPASIGSCTPVATYNDYAEDATCPTTAPLVQLPGTTCTASAGVAGNVGFWYGGGVVDYIVTSPWGTFGPYTISLGASGSNYCPLSGTCNVASLNKTVYADQEAGSTADVKLNACISGLSASGGICDATGFGATTQTIAATVTTASNVFLKMSPATVFQPATTSIDMFSVAEDSGIDGLVIDALNVSGYSGNAVKFVNNCQQTDRCYLRHAKLINGTNSTNPGTGTAIFVTANGTTNISTADISDVNIVGFQNGILVTSTGSVGSSFVNGLNVRNVRVTNAVNCTQLYSNPGDVYGNYFDGVQCEAGAGNISGANGIWIHASTSGVNLRSNMFFGGSVWDYGNGSNTQAPYKIDANASDNWIIANMPIGGNGSASDLGTNDQIWNVNYAFKVQQMGVGCLILEPAGSPDTIYSIYNNGSNIVIGNGSTCPGSNPLTLDSSGNTTQPGSVTASKLVGLPGGNPASAQASTGSADDFTVPNAAGTQNNFVVLDSGGTVTEGPVAWGNGATLVGSSSAVMQYCGVATFTSSTTSSAVACTWVTTGSHCQATWIGTGVSGGALGFTTSSASVTLTAASSSSGTAAVSCSAN
jgi:hypothetical protein